MKRCENCGNELMDNVSFCDYCGSAVKTSAAVVTGKPENIAGGAVGALIGALIGGASIILVSRLGFVAAICGLILAVCTIKGYEIMGGGTVGKVGILICVALMLVTPYIADRLDWAILLMEAYGEGITLGEAYAVIPDIITEDIIAPADYWMNLGKLYLFTLLGGVSSVVSALKKK